MPNFRRKGSYVKPILKKIILISLFFALCIILSQSAFAANVNVAWNASTGSNISGYKIYYGTSSRNYAYNVNVGKSTSASLSGLQEGRKYYFAATAYTSSAESNYSSELAYTVPTASSGSTTPTTPTSPSGTITIDNGGSGTSTSGTWITSGGSGSYGSKSVYSKSANATYTFTKSISGSQTVYLRWTSYASRYTKVPVKIYNNSSLLKTVYVNQQQNGGSWNSLGTYTFSGTAKVVVVSATSAYSTCVDGVQFIAGSSSSSSSASSSSSSSSTSGCTLNAKFQETSMKSGAQCYTDRNYTITGGVPDWMVGRTLIKTANDERSNTASSGYLRFTNTDDWWVYVLFDSRSATAPSWLKGWELTSYKIYTSLSSQPYFKVYRKKYDAGQCVDLGGNYGSGSTIETRSNYMVVYGK